MQAGRHAACPGRRTHACNPHPCDGPQLRMAGRLLRRCMHACMHACMRHHACRARGCGRGSPRTTPTAPARASSGTSEGCCCSITPASCSRPPRTCHFPLAIWRMRTWTMSLAFCRVGGGRPGGEGHCRVSGNAGIIITSQHHAYKPCAPSHLHKRRDLHDFIVIFLCCRSGLGFGQRSSRQPVWGRPHVVCVVSRACVYSLLQAQPGVMVEVPGSRGAVWRRVWHKSSQ